MSAWQVLPGGFGIARRTPNAKRDVAYSAPAGVVSRVLGSFPAYAHPCVILEIGSVSFLFFSLPLIESRLRVYLRICTPSRPSSTRREGHVGVVYTDAPFARNSYRTHPSTRGRKESRLRWFACPGLEANASGIAKKLLVIEDPGGAPSGLRAPKGSKCQNVDSATERGKTAR